MADEIDIVLTWVDGSDPAWLEQKKEYQKAEYPEMASEWRSGDKRFRDWGLLPYWFRCIEKNAPWVRRIFFVTWGHTPAWLNTEHPKLHVVRHEEFIPKEYLPTFNSHTIEFNLHRIPGLGECFVYFNDDTYLLQNTSPEDFFIDGKPREFAGLTAGYVDRNRTSYEVYDAAVINDHFVKKEVLKEHWNKWYTPLYGRRCLQKTIANSGLARFTGFQQDHLPMNLLKSTYETLWDIEKEELDAECRRRFRGFYGISPWLIRDWHRVTGNFVPKKPAFGCYYNRKRIKDRKNADKITEIILHGKEQMICINDECDTEEEFLFWQQKLIEAFSGAYITKSGFEKE